MLLRTIKKKSYSHCMLRNMACKRIINLFPVLGRESGRAKVLTHFRSIDATVFGFIPLALSLSSCASNQYMGISLLPGEADPTLQALVKRASIGEKPAQLELGLKLYVGKDVVTNRRRACKLFQMAAGDGTGNLWVYIPSPGGGAPSNVVPMRTRDDKSGIPLAIHLFNLCH